MRSTTEDEDDGDYRFRTFFSETSPGKFVPRALFIDLEPSVIDEVKSGTNSQLYNPQQFICGKEDAGNNFARGYYTQHFNVTLMFDNVSVYDICRRSLDIENPTYVNVNRLVSQAFSSLTVSMRFEGSTINQNLRSFCGSTSLGLIRFVGCSYVPVLSAKEVQHKQHAFVELTNAALEPSSYMVKYDPCKGMYMKNLIVNRGDDVDFDDVDNAASMARTRTGSGFDYFDTSYRSGINYVPVIVYPGGGLATVQREVCVVYCTTSIQDVFTRISHKFNQMYVKKDFLHSYFCEGMEEYEFSEAYEVIATKLVKLCQEFENVKIYR
ncbi:hypothetical protein H5410_014320 [Solanum commersonii]|uniref:Tubulin/FtsZ GTPase domain-containing protein n=1 Tax=Solanum commersonii TaxID=4109 RepID=A0A9J5ZQP1_SOLCO|nr:hypothetical protein H5410_014320 [Solanum commersonii]